MINEMNHSMKTFCLPSSQIAVHRIQRRREGSWERMKVRGSHERRPGSNHRNISAVSPHVKARMDE